MLFDRDLAGHSGVGVAGDRAQKIECSGLDGNEVPFGLAARFQLDFPYRPFDLGVVHLDLSCPDGRCKLKGREIVLGRAGIIEDELVELSRLEFQGAGFEDELAALLSPR